MCRHLAYVGPAVRLGKLLTDPEHSLVRQAWEPRRQQHGTVNADGFGLGWYADGDPVPARYRRGKPVWGDAAFADLVRVVRSQAVLAAVRDATHPSSDGEAAAAPFADGPWLFSHNGVLRDWPEALARPAGPAAGLPPGELLSLAARSDSAFVWALVLRRLRAGEGLGDALAGAVGELWAAAPGSRLNLLLTDGTSIAATACGDSLWYLAEPEAVGGGRTVVASEPYDDDPRWVEVPERSVLTATRTRVVTVPLPVAPLVPLQEHESTRQREPVRRHEPVQSREPTEPQERLRPQEPVQPHESIQEHEENGL